MDNLLFKVSNDMFNIINNKLVPSDVKRLQIYTTYGFTTKAFEDPNWRIRREAYRVMGYPLMALQDGNQYIRLEAAIALNLVDDYNLEYVNTILAEAI